MANKKDSNNDLIQQSWLTKTPWLSFSVFLCTYGVFGWSLANQAELWLIYLQERGESITTSVEDEIILLLIRLTALMVVIFISLSLTTPVALITFVFEESVSSDLKAFIYIFLWSVLAVFILCSFDFFADLLVLISANILLRLDLQNLSLKMWQIFLLIIFLASIAFSSGVLLFDCIHKDI
jgi:hypothetical protein